MYLSDSLLWVLLMPASSLSELDNVMFKKTEMNVLKLLYLKGQMI